MSKALREAYILGCAEMRLGEMSRNEAIAAAERNFPDRPCATVRDIVVQWLKDNGYDGLCNPDLECGCFLNDLIPCDGDCQDCFPGYRSKMIDEDSGKEIEGVFKERPGVLVEGRIVPRGGK